MTLLVAGALGWMPLGSAAAQEAQPDQPQQQPEAAPIEAQIGDGEVEQMTLGLGRSTLIRAPWRVRQVSVASSDIADVQVINPQQVLVVARSVGATDLFLWGENDELEHRRVLVEVDLTSLKQQVARLLPGADVELSQANETVMITGSLRRAEHAEQLNRYMETVGVRFVDMTRVPGVQQVMIQVRVAEASRNAVRALGINAVQGGNTAFGGSTIGGNPNNINVGVAEGASPTHGIPFQFVSDTAMNSTVTLFGGFPDADLQLFLQALVDNQYMRVLAEPTLVALSGKEASFLAGGEFPIPVVQGSGTAGTSISIEFKEFGVRLRFRPMVRGDGMIELFVAPEVSSLSEMGAVVIQGFRIPSIRTRRAETTLQMKDGQTFAMAGLIDRNVAARSQRVPGLGDLPILGSLFRSVRYEQGQTELVVLATVSLVEPMSTSTLPPLPDSMHTEPSDWELYAVGRIEGRTPARIAPTEQQWLREQGYHRLLGPGAWSRYDEAATPMRPQSRRPVNPANADPSPPADEPEADELEDEFEPGAWRMEELNDEPHEQ